MSFESRFGSPPRWWPASSDRARPPRGVPAPATAAEPRTIPIAGTLALAGDGSGALTLRFGPGTIPPDVPPLPGGVTVIRPSGGDDRGAFVQAWDSLPSDRALFVSGMLQISDTMRLSGENKRVIADPTKPSGFRSTRSEPMTGAYCAMIHLVSTAHCGFRGLEFDCAAHPNGGLYIENCSDGLIERCFIHDIGWRSSDPRALAGIFGDNATRLTLRGCAVSRTGGVLDNDGCRGIWLRGQSSLLVEACSVVDTGHTCIAVELSDGEIRDCTASRSKLNGTLYKICYRSQAAAGDVLFTGNVAQDSKDAGLMLEDAYFPLVAIEGNEFIDCGHEGSTFGAIYANEASNVQFRDNRLAGCRSTGALIRTDYALFEHNAVSDGPAVLHLEDTVSNVRLTASGDVSIGRNCSNVWVDGQQRA